MSNEARGQAEADWKALANRCIQAKRPNELVVREGVGRAASAWPTIQKSAMSQKLHRITRPNRRPAGPGAMASITARMRAR